MSRWVSLILLILLAFLQFKLWISGGMREVWRLEKAVAEQHADNDAQTTRNSELAAEVADLKEGADAVEERARSELGMVKAGETFYQVIDAQPQVAQGEIGQLDQLSQIQALDHAQDRR
jgi:cell division protein FtsB